MDHALEDVGAVPARADLGGKRRGVERSVGLAAAVRPELAKKGRVDVDAANARFGFRVADMEPRLAEVDVLIVELAELADTGTGERKCGDDRGPYAALVRIRILVAVVEEDRSIQPASSASSSISASVCSVVLMEWFARVRSRRPVRASRSGLSVSAAARICAFSAWVRCRYSLTLITVICEGRSSPKNGAR